jgi:hypothetical protein
MAGQNSQYPRALTHRERTWLEWVLPADRIGYQEYRKYLDTMVVLGEGRRGKGDIVLGYAGDTPDTTITLPPVFAYGLIETNFGPISVTVRENYGDQIDVEIVTHRGEEMFEQFEERRRWTYSTWKPGAICPQCERPPREVSMETEAGKRLVLTVCAADRRLWVHDAETMVNHLIPVTNFYNELMLHKKIRDPKIALDSNRMFTDLPRYKDDDLTYAFMTYNALKTKVEMKGRLMPGKVERRTFIHTIKEIFQARET